MLVLLASARKLSSALCGPPVARDSPYPPNIWLLVVQILELSTVRTGTLWVILWLQAQISYNTVFTTQLTFFHIIFALSMKHAVTIKGIVTSHMCQWDQSSFQPLLDRTKAHVLSQTYFLTATANCLHLDSTLHPVEVRQKPTINIFYPLVMPLYTRNHFEHCFSTLYPSSQLIQRHPLVKKHPTAWRATWGIQPSTRNWRITASIHGNPVVPWKDSTH